MIDDAKNPYVMLGIPYGATRDEANVAFALRARVAKRRPEQSRWSLTDLTWALNQIDEALANPSLNVSIYRVPANFAAISSDGEGLFNPPPERAARQTKVDDAAIDIQARLAASDALAVLVDAVVKATPLPAR